MNTYVSHSQEQNYTRKRTCDSFKTKSTLQKIKSRKILQHVCLSEYCPTSHHVLSAVQPTDGGCRVVRSDVFCSLLLAPIVMTS